MIAVLVFLFIALVIIGVLLCVLFGGKNYEDFYTELIGKLITGDMIR